MESPANMGEGSDLAILARRQYVAFAWPTVAVALGCTFFFVLWIVAYKLGLIAFWLAPILQTCTLVFLFNPLHEAVHGNITFAGRRRGRIDSAIGSLAGLLLFQPFPLFRQMHLVHHAKTNVAGRDPDLWTKADALIFVIVRCWLATPAYYWQYALYFLRQPKERRPWAGATISALIVFGALVAGIFYPVVVFGLWLVPALLAIAWIEFLHWTLHIPHASEKPYRNARIILAGGWRNSILRLLFQDMNCHLIHHLYPHIPFYRLPDVIPHMRESLVSKGAEIVSVKQAVRQYLHQRVQT